MNKDRFKEQYERQYAKIINQHPNWPQFLRQSDSRDIVLKSTGTTVEKIQKMNKDQIQKLFIDHCFRDYYIGKDWSEKPFLSTSGLISAYKPSLNAEYTDILSISLIQYLTGFVPEFPPEKSREELISKFPDDFIDEEWGLDWKKYQITSLIFSEETTSFSKIKLLKDLFNIKPDFFQIYEGYLVLAGRAKYTPYIVDTLMLWYETVKFTPNELRPFSKEAFSQIPEYSEKINKENKEMRIERMIGFNRLNRAAKEITNQYNSLNKLHINKKDNFYFEIALKIYTVLKENNQEMLFDNIFTMPFDKLRELSTSNEYKKLFWKIRDEIDDNVMSFMVIIENYLRTSIANDHKFREKVWNEWIDKCSEIYKNGFLNSTVFNHSNDNAKEIAMRYYQGTDHICYPWTDSGPYFDKKYFNSDQFLFDLYVLNKIFGPPDEETVDEFFDKIEKTSEYYSGIMQPLRQKMLDIFGEK